MFPGAHGPDPTATLGQGEPLSLLGLGIPGTALLVPFPAQLHLGYPSPLSMGFEAGAPAPSLALRWVPGHEQHLAWLGHSGTIPRPVNPEQSVLCSAAPDLNRGSGPCPAAFHKH